jgi:hypothetical protein
MGRTFKTWLKGLAAVAGAFLSVNSAQAGFTSIGKHPSFEPDQQDIIAHTYGGSWHQVGQDFYNTSGLSAKRMDDFLVTPSVLNIKTGNLGFSTDQNWSGNKFTVTAIAKWSGNSQDLSMLDSKGDTHEVFNVNGYGYAIDPASKTVDMHGMNFEWDRSGDSGTDVSLDNSNSDHRDHLITYLISGLPGVKGPVWMLFFEDMFKNSTTKKNATYADYNDLVVEVRPSVNPVPLPPAGWAGLFTLGCFSVVRGRKLISRMVMA